MSRRRSQTAFLFAIAGLVLLETWSWSRVLLSVRVEVVETAHHRVPTGNPGECTPTDHEP
jgi:hypothetical protein